MVFLCVLLAVVIIVIWFMAVRHLMARPDADFPGQYDKIAWAIILTFTPLFGPLVYFFFPNLRAIYDQNDQYRHSQEIECLRCGP